MNLRQISGESAPKSKVTSFIKLSDCDRDKTGCASSHDKLQENRQVPHVYNHNRGCCFCCGWFIYRSTRCRAKPHDPVCAALWLSKNQSRDQCSRVCDEKTASCCAHWNHVSFTLFHCTTKGRNLTEYTQDRHVAERVTRIVERPAPSP